MTGIFSRLLSARSKKGPSQAWERVPRVNVLPRGRAVSRKGTLRFALVAVIVLIGAFLVVQLREGQAAQAATETVRKELQQVQVRVATGQQAIDELQGEVDAARAAVASVKESYQQLTSGKTNLYAGMNSLIGMEVDGISFDTVVVTPAGQVTLAGSADNVEAMSKFQAGLRSITDQVKLVNIGFESTAKGLKFTASLQVAK